MLNVKSSMGKLLQFFKSNLVVLSCLISSAMILPLFLPLRVVTENLPFDTSNPFIWDNDANHDVFTQELVMALAHNGTINLIAITKSPHPYETTSEDLQAVVVKARNSGLQNIPDATWDLGSFYMTALTRPSDGNIDSTQPIDTAPARMIKDKVLQVGTTSKPVVVGAGGCLTTIASAYLLAKNEGRAAEFASKIIIVANNGQMANSLSSYNTFQDSWAAYICLARMKMVVSTWIDTGIPKIWHIIDTLPDNELTQYMRWKKGPQWPYKDTQGDGDAHPVLAFLLPTQGHYFTGTTRISFDYWAPWNSSWGHHGPNSINSNAFLADMKVRVDSGSDDIFITGYNQPEADSAWKDAFTTAFSGKTTVAKPSVGLGSQ
jgi:hypothetical protein